MCAARHRHLHDVRLLAIFYAMTSLDDQRQQPPHSDRLDELLEERFGLTSFRPGQREVIRALELHRGALAVFPTGGGKSLCYQLPALVYDGVTVVVSPLIALMKDQIDFLRGRGVRAARLDSSLGRDEARQVDADLADGSLRLLYVAPERFNNERFLKQLERTPIALFAVDEAHCISEWGHNFRPDYLKLAETARNLGVQRVLALTATATPEVVADICNSFRIPAEAAVITGFHRPNLFLSTSPVPIGRRDSTLLDRIRSRPPGSSIIYVTLQKTAERVAASLADAGIPARPYHAGMNDEARAEVQEWWKCSDRGIVVATIAFGMGIDKSDVRYVYHYNLPKGLESYSQEIGRAGRDGESALVELLGSLDDVAVLENFAFGDTPTREAIGSLLHDLFSREADFDVSLYSLGNDHDIRPLVLRTALTYLELLGVLRQGTPFYAGYKIRPREPVEQIASRFAGERQQFISSIFSAARKGREWYSIDIQTALKRVGSDRERVLAALNYLADQQLVDLQVSDARNRFTRTSIAVDLEALASELESRFSRREDQEVTRIARMVSLISCNGCQTAHLLQYFGQQLTGPCGHCTFCETGRPTALEPVPQSLSSAELIPIAKLDEVRTSHPQALSHPRQIARFLCGLSSPATSRARLTRNPLFGTLEGRRFAEVLDWCEASFRAVQARNAADH
ncbi:RecQ family ATP-dependent DNA helicase [soil metagenome]